MPKQRFSLCSLPRKIVAAAITLVMMNISALAGVASLPPLSVPDFWVCDHWYAAANELMTEDCVMAVRSMPSGFDRVPWHNGAGGSEEYRFPLTRTHGSCKITVFASGKWATENELQVNLSPYTLRQLVLYLIQECVVTDQEGGYATHGFKHAADWVTGPSSNFPTNLDMPASTTYFTAMVRNSANNDAYDPGNVGPLTSLAMMEALGRAVRRAKSGSYLRADLEMRRRYVAVSKRVQETGLDFRHAWWENWVHPELLLPTSIENITENTTE